ncbi:MAG TPA: PKD domain-containing protein, partial [Nocardioidaceae bacterium]|nr:PKD domain-containing protein [Nocardioidaceae bacterium]
ADAYTSGGGSVTEAVADSNGPRTGSVSGTTATTSSTSARGVNWSIVLAPQSGNPPSNAAPTAMFTQSCTNLVCQFNGSGSSDSDGTIESHAWNFGGDGTGSGETVNHTFSTAGTYSVALTVTDDDGAPDTSTMNVTVSSGSQSGSISFVDSATRATNTRTPEVSVPGSVQAGDTLLLTAGMGNATSAGAPAGWTLKGEETSTSSLRSLVWVKTATSGDAGTSVEVVMDAIHKVTLAITAYRGVNATQVTATPNTDSNTNSHTTPAVTVPAGSWLASFWADKSSNTNWSTPGSVTRRADAYTSGGGSVTEAVADSNGPRTGSVSGTTATTSSTSARGVNWSILLPAQ